MLNTECLTYLTKRSRAPFSLKLDMRRPIIVHYFDKRAENRYKDNRPFKIEEIEKGQKI